MACSMCFFRNPVPWIVVLVLVLVCAGFVGCGSSPILFSALFLILSSIFFTSSKHKPVPVETSEKDKAQVEEVVQEVQHEEAQEGEVGQVHGYMVGSLDPFSESESIDQSSTTDQDSEADWPYAGNLSQSPDCSDDSISDEESLIEIALPSGHYVGPKKEEESKTKSHQKFPDFSPEPIFNQHSLMELLAEINDMNEEDDNLIEIDISMGSIKCSRFEIEA